ncbi:ABC transporter permease subunit [Cystobacter ferrugineus]|uniref:ABC transporter permease subunit n=1 Tax=Cystobacter ferrugineus TaxID=83449 RepID=UPI001FE4EFA8|nr:ABC transporter permease subunit [Cystobacter ferrugineus]
MLTLRERDYVRAARALGASDAHILWYHVLPNAAGPLIIQATSALPGTLLAGSSLSFLGLGAPPGDAVLGSTGGSGHPVPPRGAPCRALSRTGPGARGARLSPARRRGARYVRSRHAERR